VSYRQVEPNRQADGDTPDSVRCDPTNGATHQEAGNCDTHETLSPKSENEYPIEVQAREQNGHANGNCRQRKQSLHDSGGREELSAFEFGRTRRGP
jgi:hypothetical protein